MKNLILLLILITNSSFAQITQPEFDKFLKLNQEPNLEKAILNLSVLEKKYPKDPKVIYLKGLLELSKKQIELALFSFSIVIETIPSFVKALEQRANVYCQIGQFQNAINDQTKAIKLFPKDINLLSKRAFFYSKNKQYQESLNDLKAKIKLAPNNVMSYFEAANINKMLHPDANSDVFFEQAYAVKGINKKDIDKIFGHYLLENGRFIEAEQKYKNVILDSEKDLNSEDFQNIAIAFSKNQNYKNAINYFEKSIALSPKNVLLRNNLSSLFIELKKWENLKENAESTLLIDPNNAMANMYMAIGLKYTGNEKLASEFEAKSKQLENAKD